MEMTAREWIARCSARLQQQWRTVDPDQLDDLANDLWADEKLRRMPAELAAVEWLSQGIPLSAPGGEEAAQVSGGCSHGR